MSPFFNPCSKHVENLRAKFECIEMLVLKFYVRVPTNEACECIFSALINI